MHEYNVAKNKKGDVDALVGALEIFWLCLWCCGYAEPFGSRYAGY